MMKLQSLLVAVCLLSISTVAYTQDKGYYSIGNNKQKLQYKSDRQAPDRFFRIDKGYYHIESNRSKLPRSLRENDAQYRLIPVITKGYYSIGSNSEKLRRN